MKSLNIALIGAGNIAKGVHMPALAAKEGVNVIAICDIHLEKAQKLADEYGVKQVFQDYKDVLALEGLDAVDICTPNDLHSIIAVDALTRGIHVFTEKPDAISPSEAMRMKQAAEQSGKVLMAMRNNRFMPTSQFWKQFANDGEMGEIYAGRCAWRRRRGIPGKGGWFTTKEKSGGGPLIDLGVHMIDLAIWLMGNPKPVSVSGSTFCKFANTNDASDSEHSKFGEAQKDGIFDVEDLAMGFIRFDNGACLQVECSWASNIKEEVRFVELMGTKAGGAWSSQDERLHLFTQQYGHTVNVSPNIDNHKAPSPHKANIHHFVDVIRKGETPIFTPQQGIDMIKVLDAMYRSAETGHEVRL